MGQMGHGFNREKMVAEYVAGGVSLRELEQKYGTSRSTISRWVNDYLAGRMGGKRVRVKPGGSPDLVIKDVELSADVRQLRRELEEARLYNRLLNAMIDIAEEQFEIPIRKKSGAKQR